MIITKLSQGSQSPHRHCRSRMWHPLAWLIWFCLVNSVAIGEVTFPQKIVETGIAYDYLDPPADYAEWQSLDFSYSHRFHAQKAIQFAGGASQRDNRFVWLQTALYRDWQPRFYTYSSLTGASSTAWMGRLRLDNDLNFKLGKQKSLILVTGQSYILYSIDKADYMLSGGLVYYLLHVVAEGRVVFTRSDPGNIISNTTNLSLSAGSQDHYWATLSVSKGTQAYLSEGAHLPVNQEMNSVLLQQRMYITKKTGLKLGIAYLNVENGYEKYHLSGGFFYHIP